MSDSGNESRSCSDAGAPVERRPPAHAGWAVVALLFFWPLSFAAFTHAFEVHPRWSDGDRDGARHASNRVRRLGQVSLWIGGSIAVVLLVLYVLVHRFLHPKGLFRRVDRRPPPPPRNLAVVHRSRPLRFRRRRFRWWRFRCRRRFLRLVTGQGGASYGNSPRRRAATTASRREWASSLLIALRR
ncbi:CD225/dispanin family protein [Prescottella equi]|uniref:CD225/dispanin family protein n=1 Tax=Rhodococcus hoagii TaxID=43767 RepID=UPI0009C19E09